MLQIKIDARELVNLSQKLAAVPKELRDQATAQALNRVAAKGKTEIDRAVRDEFVIDAARVRNALDVRPASARLGRIQAEIRVFGSSRRKGRSLNVIHFLERKVTLAEARRRQKAGTLFGKGKGGRQLPMLSFNFKRGQGGKTIPGSFVGNKGRTVFMRTGDARLPIKPVQVIDVPQMFRSKKIQQRVIDRIQRELGVEIDRSVKFVLSKLK